MQQASNNKRVITIAAVIAVIVIGLLVILVQGVTSIHDSTAPSGNSAADENTPAVTGSSLVGYDNLLSVGVTANQAGALQQAFQKYKPTAAAGAVIDMSKSALTPHEPNPHDPLYRPSIGTSVVVNQKTTYQIKFYYWGTSSVELLIYDSTGKTKLFDSGTVVGNS